jgi:hypothetical protein
MLAFEIEKPKESPRKVKPSNDCKIGKKKKKKKKKSSKKRKSKLTNGQEDLFLDDDPDKNYNEDDVDRYRARSGTAQSEQELTLSENGRKLEARVVTLSILPYFIGLLLVSYISVQSFENQNNDIVSIISNSAKGTNQRFTKNISELIADKLILSISSAVDGLIDIKTYLTTMKSSNGAFIINPENGDYGDLFKQRVNQNLMKNNCRSILNILPDKDSREKMQSCLIMNNLYPTLKYYDWSNYFNGYTTD